MASVDATLTKRGNGRDALLPKEVCDASDATIGDKLSLGLDEANQIIRIENPGSSTLHSLMAGYDDPKPGEADAPDASAGNELW